MTQPFSIAAMVAAIALASCGEKAAETSTPTAAPPAATAASTTEAPTTKSGQGVGVVTEVNAQAGTITLNHEPIPAVGWPAMTMGFKADPGLLKDVRVGDKVQFDLTTGGTAAVVTGIRKP